MPREGTLSSSMLESLLQHLRILGAEPYNHNHAAALHARIEYQQCLHPRATSQITPT